MEWQIATDYYIVIKDPCGILNANTPYIKDTLCTITCDSIVFRDSNTSMLRIDPLIDPNNNINDDYAVFLTENEAVNYYNDWIDTIMSKLDSQKLQPKP